MFRPLVSVVIPAYNHEEYVEQSIRSVLDQTYQNIELLVVDDGSKDGTWSRIQSLQRTATRPFTAITKPNSGVSSTLNYGIARTRGEFVALLASDDYFLPEKIELQIKEFERAPENLALVHTSAFNDHGDGRLVDFTGMYVPAEGDCFRSLLACEAQVVAPSVLFRRSAYDAIGGFDEKLGAEDFDFYVRLAADGFGFRCLRRPLLVKRETAHNLSRNIENSHASRLAMLAKYKGRIDPDLYDYACRGALIATGENQIGAGNLRASFEAYREASALGGERRLMIRWGGRVVRSLVLRATPEKLRGLMRVARSRLLRGRH